MHLSRRLFLLAATFIQSVDLCADDISLRFRALMPARESARAIARIYLAENPSESHRSSVIGAILPALSLDLDALRRLNDESLLERVRSGIRADFENGQTVNIAGWVLSRLESRICVLCA
jgi:hypothetical protein